MGNLFLSARKSIYYFDEISVQHFCVDAKIDGHFRSCARLLTENVHIERVLDETEIVFHHARVVSRVRHFHTAQRVIERYSAGPFFEQNIVFVPRKHHRRRT